MQVKLIQSTPNPLEMMWAAARNCYSDVPAWKLFQDAHEAQYSEESEASFSLRKLDLVKKVLSSGHQSIAEHVMLTFTIDGITRACSHQLVRHRLAVYSQKSQRYITNKSEFEYTMPKSIVDAGWQEAYKSQMLTLHHMYNQLIQNGVPAEDARSILPNACHTSVVVSMNLREFTHVCELRLCKRAQQEIGELFHHMAWAVLEIPEYKFLADFLRPKCERCVEHARCK